MTRLLLAGSDGLPSQDHQRDMWLPAARRIGADIVAIWAHPDAEAAEIGRVERLSAAEEITLVRDAVLDLRGVDGIICCQRGARREIVLRAARDAGVPVLLDKPTIDASDALDELALSLPGMTLLAGHHFAAHPSFLRALRAVRAGEIGLLRAVHAELVVARGDGPADGGELRNLGVYPTDLVRRLVGPAELRVSADVSHGAQGDEQGWTLLAQSERDVVVGIHVTRTADGAPEVLSSRVRILGSHGSLLVDLTAPHVRVRSGRGTIDRPYGPGSVDMLVAGLTDPDARAELEVSLQDLAGISRFLDVVSKCAVTREVVGVQW
jgi:predicted dehydrogenase